MNIQYQYPQAFYLLILVPILLLIFAGYLLWKKKTISRVGSPHLVKALFNSHSSIKSYLKFALLAIAFAAGCLALANPRMPDESSAEARKGIDLVFALDVSNSMLATDVAPDRLTRAKQFLNKLLEGLKNDRVGFVVFAGNSYLQMPLTFDQGAARMYIATADPELVAAQGTNITEALKKATLAFGEDEERFRSIVLITDGENHDEGVAEELKNIASKGIMINTVGIGSPEGATILDSAGQERVDPATGQPVVSRLNETVLKEMAAATNGTYVQLQSTDAAVSTIMSQYANIEKKALNDTSLYTYTSFYHWLVAPMILFLLVELLISDRKKLSK